MNMCHLNDHLCYRGVKVQKDDVKNPIKQIQLFSGIVFTETDQLRVDALLKRLKEQGQKRPQVLNGESPAVKKVKVLHPVKE